MTATHYRYAHNESGVQRRYFEMRFDADERRVSGTAMKYGDTATLPWGEKERFEPGAFGEVAGSDVTLNVQHDRARLIARTGADPSGGLLTLRDTGNELTVSAVLPDTQEANDAVKNIRARLLRGMSVEFIPKQTRMENDTIVVEEATLRGIGVVDRPSYTKSKVLPRSEVDMNDADIKGLIERTVTELLSKRSDPAAPVDATAIATALSGALGTALADLPTAESVREQVEGALKQRDEAEAKRAKAETDRKAAEAKAKTDREEAEANAETRADLLMTIKPLLPEGTEVRGKSNHELLVLAVGDEVTDAGKRSEDYLLAKVETIAERREAAAGGPAPAATGGNGNAPGRVYGGPGFSIAGAVAQRADARTAERRA